MPRVTKICPICGNRFESLSSRNRIYCSQKCMHKDPKCRKGRAKLPLDKRICPYCGKQFEVHPWLSKRFCCVKCGVRYRAENMPNAVDRKDTRVPSKRREIRYERKTKDGRRVRMHRLVMEEKLGRQLQSSEQVHHIDMDSSNNSIENLYLYANARDHTKGHHSVEKLIKSLIEDRVIGFEFGKYFRIDGKIAEG